jgi:hypothetical protein
MKLCEKMGIYIFEQKMMEEIKLRRKECIKVKDKWVENIGINGKETLVLLC